jgi:hypothetical protein
VPSSWALNSLKRRITVDNERTGEATERTVAPSLFAPSGWDKTKMPCRRPPLSEPDALSKEDRDGAAVPTSPYIGYAREARFDLGGNLGVVRPRPPLSQHGHHGAMRSARRDRRIMGATLFLACEGPRRGVGKEYQW